MSREADFLIYCMERYRHTKLYAAPVLTLISVCDRQPEREGECLEKLQKHVALFFGMVHKVDPQEKTK